MQTEQTTTFSRRSVMSAIAGLSATSIASLPAMAGPDPDAELIALGQRHAVLQSQRGDALDRYFACHDATVRPPEPEALRRRPDDTALLANPPRETEVSEHYASREVEGLRARPRRRRLVLDFDPITGQTWPQGTAPAHIQDTLTKSVPWPEAQARAEGIIAAHDAHKRACETADARSGFTQAQQALRALEADIDAVEEAIISTPATTMAGVAVKVRLAEQWIDDDCAHVAEWGRGSSVMLAITRDLMQMI